MKGYGQNLTTVYFKSTRTFQRYRKILTAGAAVPEMSEAFDVALAASFNSVAAMALFEKASLDERSCQGRIEAKRRM